MQALVEKRVCIFGYTNWGRPQKRMNKVRFFICLKFKRTNKTMTLYPSFFTTFRLLVSISFIHSLISVAPASGFAGVADFFLCKRDALFI